jgi:hypothetical protein
MTRLYLVVLSQTDLVTELTSDWMGPLSGPTLSSNNFRWAIDKSVPRAVNRINRYVTTSEKRLLYIHLLPK